MGRVTQTLAKSKRNEIGQSLLELIKNHRSYPTRNAKKQLAYFRPQCPDAFARFMGCNDGGIFLSRLIYWSERAKRKDGYFYKSMADWMNELQIGERKVLRFRRELEERNIIETKLIKANGKPTTHYKLNKEILADVFGKYLDSEYLFPDYGGQLDEAVGEIETYESADAEVLDAEIIEDYPINHLRQIASTDQREQVYLHMLINDLNNGYTTKAEITELVDSMIRNGDEVTPRTVYNSLEVPF